MARTISLLEEIFALNANTTIPPTPVPGTAYRNEAITDVAIEKGWTYASPPVDSAGFNEVLYRVAALLNLVEKQGMLEWSALTNYAIGTFTRGSTDYKIYQALLASGPDEGAGTKDPDSGGNPTYWLDYAADIDTGFTLASNIKTSSYLLTAADSNKLNMMNAATPEAFTFPAIVDGTPYFIKNIGAGVLTLTPDGAETIEVITLAQNESVMLQGDLVNTKWRTVADKVVPVSFITFVDINKVTNQAIPSSFTDLDLSAIVGSNTALVLMRIEAIGGQLDFKSRTNGDTLDIDSGAGWFGGGTSAATISSNDSAYTSVKTDSAGIIEVAKASNGTNYSLDVIAYMK